MPPLFGNTQKNSIEDLKKQVEELQKKLDVQTQAQIQTGQAIQSVLAPVLEKEEVLFKWSAPERIFIKKDKQWYWTAALVVLITTVILLIFGEPILVGAVFSILFVLYVTTTVPPPIIDHQLTTLGIRTAGNLYRWEILDKYWFSFKQNKEMLNIETKLNTPRLLVFFFTKRDKAKILEVLKTKLPYKEVPEKEDWIIKKSEGNYIPLEDIETSITLDKQYEKAAE